MAIRKPTLPAPNSKAIVEGTITVVKGNDVFIDIGYKREGRVDLSEFSDDPASAKPGKKVQVLVLERENYKTGIPTLSKKAADVQIRWEKVLAQYTEGCVVSGTIQGQVHGGLLVDIDGVEAFLPGSQVDVFPVRNLTTYIGQTFDFKVIKISNERKNIIVSRRELIEGTMAEKHAKLNSQREELVKRNPLVSKKKSKNANLDWTNIGILEGKTVEFKKSIIFSSKNHLPGEDKISEIAETCAAFMNTDGGELYLGIDDKGFVTGIESDLAYLEKASIHGLNGETDEEYSYSATPDGFQRKLINAIKMYISTDAATNHIDGPFFITDEKSGLTYAKLIVKAVEKTEVVYFGSKWHGAPRKVFVRIGASTEFLEGEDLVTFILKRFGLVSNGQ